MPTPNGKIGALMDASSPTGTVASYRGDLATFAQALNTQVNAIYNPLANSLHAPWNLAAIEAGKPVLTEKPSARNRSEAERVAEAERVFEVVGLAPAAEVLQRYPHELSGGQRQRVGFAQALEQRGFRVTRIDVGRDIASVLAALRPAAALSVLHGRPGEDGYDADDPEDDEAAFGAAARTVDDGSLPTLRVFPHGVSRKRLDATGR